MDLKKAGLFRYAESLHTFIWGFAYRFDDGAVRQWRNGQPLPQEVVDHIERGGTVVAHNAAFERTMWNWVLRRDYPHIPLMTITQMDCTMARAAALGYPQALDKLGVALKTNMQKDMRGHAVMLKMAKPRKYELDGSITWWDAPDLIDENMAYCEQDVRTETEADHLLCALSPYQRAIWEFDQIINERGVSFDMEAVRRSSQLVDYAKKRGDAVMRQLTNRAVSKCSKDREIIEWLNGRGVKCDSLAKGSVDDVVFLASTFQDDTAEDVIKLRQASWKTSTAKYRAMEKCVSSDNRIRGLLNWHGAATGRWAGRLVQPQNFPRVDPDNTLLSAKIEWLHEMLRRHDLDPRAVYDNIEAVYGPLEPLDLLSKALRSMIVAGPGKKLVSGDFSNVEGRVNVWLAGETWKLQAFADFDNGIGHDLYKLAYAKSFGEPVESIGKGFKRQIGKVQELAFGFQGGVGSYISMGANYGVNPYTLTKPVRDAVTPEQWYEVSQKYHVKGTSKFGLYESEWTALKIIVENWRAAHPATVGMWWEYQDAAIEAVSSPGTVVMCAHQRVQYYCDQRSLWCVLPSKRMLHYPDPEIVVEIQELTDKDGNPYTRERRKVVVSGQDGVTKQWVRYGLYGGLQCENIVQATAADLLIEAMFRVEHAGFPVILTVHDEIVAEPDKDRDDLSAGLFEQIMAYKPEWAAGLPLAVGAWEDERYIK